MRELWRPPPASDAQELVDLTSWFHDLLDPAAHHGDGSIDPNLVHRAQDVAHQLIGSTEAPALLHGDLHHFNILRAERQLWLAIDPKGLIGDPGFDIAAFMRNPSPRSAAVHASRRLDILSSELGLDRQRTRDWCFAEAVLNACWSRSAGVVEKLGDKIAWAELVATL
jgi:streptomycin 6-kinase